VLDDLLDDPRAVHGMAQAGPGCSGELRRDLLNEDQKLLPQEKRSLIHPPRRYPAPDIQS
jgi:hypothetical protein